MPNTSNKRNTSEVDPKENSACPTESEVLNLEILHLEAENEKTKNWPLEGNRALFRKIHMENPIQNLDLKGWGTVGRSWVGLGRSWAALERS